MRIIPWTLPIKAVWTRALDLREQRLASRKLILILQEESGDLWQITFSPIQAFRVLTEECAASVLSKLPQDGGLFEVIESSWILPHSHAAEDVSGREVRLHLPRSVCRLQFVHAPAAIVVGVGR